MGDILTCSTNIVCICWRNAAACLKSSISGERGGEVYGSFTSIAPVAHNITSVNLIHHRPVSVAQSAPVQKMLVTEDPYTHKLNGFDQHTIDSKGSKKNVGTSSKYAISGVYGSQQNVGLERRDNFDGSFNFDASFADPGYVSEKSDYSEDENVERANVESSKQDKFIGEPSDGSIITIEYVMKICPFITYDNIFFVNLIKNSRGLGLSVTGGTDCDIIWSGLIRVKNIFPQTPAALCHQLELSDILLEANGVPLTGLSSHEALEVLRTSGAQVKILGCRPPNGVFDTDDNTSQCAVQTSLTIPSQNNYYSSLIPSPSYSTYGDFEINITKVNGSLGFTLRKQDNSILGHTVRSLVKEPSLSDGRIRPGDKLLSVNGTDMCGLSHEEAVRFLRTCPETVGLRLYRDAMQTPVSPASPIETEFFSKPKQLRKEARDMLTDLAFRKQTSSANFSGSVNSDTTGSNRRRRLQKTPSPDINAANPERWDSLVRKSEENEQYNASKLDNQHGLNQEIYNENTKSSLQCEGGQINKMDPSYRPKRPNFLDLISQSNCSRKAKLTPPNNELTYDVMSELQSPQMTSLDSVPALKSTQSDAPNFNRSQPSYHSVNLGALQGTDQELTNTTSDHDINSHTKTPDKQKGLLKWKGIVFTPEEEEEQTDSLQTMTKNQVTENCEIVTINLSRGWNSRLGFSLQPRNNKTLIVDVYSESLAARDGRLKVGDEIIKVNEEIVTNWPTENVIELLRKTRGKICLEVRKTVTN